MHRCYFSKRGSTSIFLMMILASTLLAAGMFIHASSQAAGRSYADAVFDLAGRSVLSEYDLELQKRYGIFAVHMDEKQAEEKIRYYADYSFHDNQLKEFFRGREYIDALKLELDSVNVDLKGYSITNIDLFEQQLLEDMKYGIIKNLLNEEPEAAEGNQNAVLRNEQIINSLPSNGYQGSFLSDIKRIVENGLPSLSEIEETSKNIFLLDEYIMSHFYNHRRGNEVRETFFANEVEYILKGNYDDQKNCDTVRRDLFVLRNVLNLAQIKQDPEKWGKVEAAAAVLTLAKGKEIGAIVVAEAWAAAESENDMRLLFDGKKVAFIKGKLNWAVPISASLEYLWNEDYYTPPEVIGYDYEDYLRLLLFLENREKKLLRCMDLIHLNMKCNYNREFNLKEYYGGFQFEAVTQEETFTYVEKF